MCPEWCWHCREPGQRREGSVDCQHPQKQTSPQEDCNEVIELIKIIIIGAFPYHSVVRKLSISLTTKVERNSGLRGE